MIRKLKKEEIEKIAEHYEREMAQQFKKVGEEPISKNEYAKRLKSSYNKDNMFVLDENGLKGFLWFAECDSEINLEEIFVLEKDKGYGRKLIDFILKFARENKIKKLNLDVHFNNKEAISFFKKFGFTERTIEMSLDLH